MRESSRWEGVISRQSFNPIERYAFWKAYGRICYICRTPLALDEVELDHLIPEYLYDHPSLINLKFRLGLSDVFDLRDYENIAVSCSACNNRKSNSVLPDITLILSLQVAATRASRVKEIVEFCKQKDRVSLYRYFSRMARQYESNVSGQEDAMLAYDTLRKSVNEKFITAMSSLTIDDVNVRSLSELEEHVILDDVGISMVHEDGRSQETRSYADYRRAKADGFQPETTVDIKAASGIFEPFGALISILKTARFPTSSYIDVPREGVTSLRLMPSTILEAPCGTAEVIAGLGGAVTINDLIKDDKARIFNVDSDEVGIIFEDFHNNIVEIARGDLDGDGIEEILAIVNVQSISGTMGYSRMVLLRRRSKDNLFEVESFEAL